METNIYFCPFRIHVSSRILVMGRISEFWSQQIRILMQMLKGCWTWTNSLCTPQIFPKPPSFRKSELHLQWSFHLCVFSLVIWWMLKFGHPRMQMSCPSPNYLQTNGYLNPFWIHASARICSQMVISILCRIHVSSTWSFHFIIKLFIIFQNMLIENISLLSEIFRFQMFRQQWMKQIKWFQTVFSSSEG